MSIFILFSFHISWHIRSRCPHLISGRWLSSSNKKGRKRGRAILNERISTFSCRVTYNVTICTAKSMPFSSTSKNFNLFLVSLDLLFSNFIWTKTSVIVTLSQCQIGHRNSSKNCRGEWDLLSQRDAGRKNLNYTAIIFCLGQQMVDLFARSICL